MARHVNIPIFIPHEGCNNSCVFCNQRTITGTSKGSDRDIRPEILAALSTIEENADVEIAFFGGSFTGIGNDKIKRLCDTAFDFVKQGKVKSIRLSTRPDYIDEEILDILKERGVTHIELGIQSASDKVLSASKRGHLFSDTQNACYLINKHGFILGGQMMIGLPSSTIEDEIYTARQIVALGCKEARIYPCVVFYNTELCQMAKSNTYTPLSIEQAVERSASVYGVLKDAGIKILRIGLQSSENLSDENEVYGGANHPALGELVQSEYIYNMLFEKIKALDSRLCQGKDLHIRTSKSNLSKVIGQNKTNKLRLEKFAKSKGFNNIKIYGSDSITGDGILICPSGTAN